jgi:hypothetical protein
MEFAVPTRRKSLAPPTDEHRHPFLEGDAPAPFVPVKRATPATAQMQSGMPQWRSSVRQMQPTSAGAAGMTDARRAEIAERAVDPNRGRRFSPSPARPRDGREASPPRGRSFSARSHLLHVDRVPYGHDERAEKAPNSPRREGGSSPRGGGRGRGPRPPGGAPAPFDDDGGGGESAVSYERDDRNTRGFGLDEADCFGRAPSPRRHRPNWQHESHFSFADEGANANDSRLASDAKRAAAARNLARTASLDARAQEEDRFRTLKARGPEYAWARRGVATADPNALWGSRDESDESEGGFTKKEKRGGRALGPRRDAATLEAEREARVVGVEWGSTPPPGSSRDGNPKPKSDAWGLSPESVGAIQLGAGVYREYPGADVLENEDALDSAPPRFVDPRASEKAAHEKALYASTAARFDDATMEELSANRARCEAGGAGRVLGHFLYEARGEEETETRNAAAAREGAARARPPSPKRAGPENSEKTDMFGVLAGG